MKRVKRSIAQALALLIITPTLALAQAPPPPEAAAAPEAAAPEVVGVEAQVDAVFGEIVNAMAKVLLWTIPGIEKIGRAHV